MSDETCTLEPPRAADAAEAGIDDLRSRIDDVDRELARLMAERTALAVELGRRKRRAGLPLQDPAREAEVVRRAAGRARSNALDEEVVRRIYWSLIDLSTRAQREDG